jgi:hypothetical protein
MIQGVVSALWLAVGTLMNVGAAAHALANPPHVLAALRALDAKYRAALRRGALVDLLIGDHWWSGGGMRVHALPHTVQIKGIHPSFFVCTLCVWLIFIPTVWVEGVRTVKQGFF